VLPTRCRLFECAMPAKHLLILSTLTRAVRLRSPLLMPLRSGRRPLVSHDCEADGDERAALWGFSTRVEAFSSIDIPIDEGHRKFLGGQDITYVATRRLQDPTFASAITE
jgi:hypothetical protein